MKLRSSREILTFRLPESLKQINLPEYINTNEKWTFIVYKSWNMNKLKNTIFKIWKNETLKTKQKKQITSFLCKHRLCSFENTWSEILGVRRSMEDSTIG
jgi:hypothetical protein